MSDAFGSIIGDAAGAYALIGGSNRSIGTIVPMVAVEEVHHDTAVLTQHPVETGSPVTDHMFLMPQLVELRWAWSDSAAQAVGYSTEVYNELLKLQSSRKPFAVSTAKRQYDKMQIVSLTAKTDIETAGSILPICVCQQIIQVDVQTTGGGTSPNTNGSTAPDKPANSNSDFITRHANDTVAVGTVHLGEVGSGPALNITAFESGPSVVGHH